MKNKAIALLILWHGLSLMVCAQQPIDVAESTLKISGMGEEVFYFGFAEGDKLVFNFQEVNGKELKELEIIELPSSSKFMDYKTKKIENKVLEVTRKGIYKFRFANSAILGRICKFKIQRIPLNESTRNFNPSVYLKMVNDTTYTPVQERYLVKSDTVIVPVLEKQITKISSQSALNGNPNRALIDFALPEGTFSWSFHLSVGQEGNKSYEASKEKFVTSAASAVSSLPGYGPLAALAIHGVNTFSKAGGGDNVKYYFISDWDNVLAFNAGQQFMQYKQGDVIAEAAQMKYPSNGKVYIGVVNDNLVDAIQVNLSVTAIQLRQEWNTRTVNKMNIIQRQRAYLNN